MKKQGRKEIPGTFLMHEDSIGGGTHIGRDTHWEETHRPTPAWYYMPIGHTVQVTMH